MDKTGVFIIVLSIVLLVSYVVVKFINILEWKIKKDINNEVDDTDIVQEVIHNVDNDFWK